MKTQKWSIAVLSIWAAGLAAAQNITGFQNGYLTFQNSDTNLYYRVEFRPNLSGSEEWSNGLPLNVRSAQPEITVPVGVIYRVAGQTNPWPEGGAASVPRTGWTNSTQAGDDGAYKRGVAWPQPRFTVQFNTNVVRDNLTGLLWARNANLNGPMTWSNAIVWCEGLTYGDQSDWRMPNVRELLSLIDYGRLNPALCDTAGTGPWTENDPFTGVQYLSQPQYYWSSSPSQVAPAGFARVMTLDAGDILNDFKSGANYVWPVRGGP